MKNEKRAVSRRRTGLILHFLRGNAHLFLIALVFSMLNTVFNALTPQIIRITVDSIIGGAPAAIPGFIKGIVPEGIFAGSGMAALLLAAGAVLAVSILSGVSMYLSYATAFMNIFKSCLSPGMCNIKPARSFSAAPPMWM